MKTAEESRLKDAEARRLDALARKMAEEGRLKDSEARERDSTTIQETKETIVQMYNGDMQDDATLLSIMGIEAQPPSNPLSAFSNQEEIKKELGGTTDNLPKFMMKEPPGDGQAPVPAVIGIAQGNAQAPASARNDQDPSSDNSQVSPWIGNDNYIDPDL